MNCAKLNFVVIVHSTNLNAKNVPIMEIHMYLVLVVLKNLDLKMELVPFAPINIVKNATITLIFANNVI